MGGHVTWQVMPFPEGLVAYGALELLLAPPLDQRLHGVLLFVVGPHVVNQVWGHAEGGVALGAPVLSGQTERGEWGRQQGESWGHLKLDRSGVLGPEGGGVDKGVLLGHAARHGAVGAQFCTLQLGSKVVSLVESVGGDGVAHRWVAVQQLGWHHQWWDLRKGARWLTEGTLPLPTTATSLLADGGESTAHGRALGRLRLWQHRPDAKVLLRGVAAGPASIFVFRVGALETFAAAVLFGVLGWLNLSKGAALYLPQLYGAWWGEGPVVVL